VRSRLAAAVPFAALVVAQLASCADALEGSGAGGEYDSGGASGGADRESNVGSTGAVGGGGSGPVVYRPENESTNSSSVTGSGVTGTSSGPGGASDAEGGGGLGGAPPDLCPSASDYGVTAFATVDDSNSYASPMLVRELTSDSSWTVGDPLPVRAHEFLNAYGQKIEGGLHTENVGDSIQVGVDARVDDYVDQLDRRLVRLAVSVTSFNAAEVAVPDVTFVMDASSSMGGEPVERLQAVLRGAGRTIAETRSVAALSTKGGGTVVRPMQLWNGDVEPIATAAAELDPDADLERTLDQAFDIARAQADESGAPGVVLVVTDGTNPLSIPTENRVVQERQAWPPVRVVGVGVGPARSYVDELLDKVTDDSGGAYFYAPSEEAAEEELAARFTSLTQIAARGVELQLEVPPSMQVVGVAGSEAPATESLADGQNLGADSSMIFQIYLLAPAEVECPTVGLSLSWTDPNDPNGGSIYFPEDGALRNIEIWRRFALEPQPSDSYRRIEAILATADAMRGPTSARVGHAASAMDAFLRDVPGDPVTAMCAPLARFCTDGNVDCLICSAP
jgi:hypothetical protein